MFILWNGLRLIHGYLPRFPMTDVLLSTGYLALKSTRFSFNRSILQGVLIRRVRTHFFNTFTANFPLAGNYVLANAEIFAQNLSRERSWGSEPTIRDLDLNKFLTTIC